MKKVAVVAGLVVVTAGGIFGAVRAADTATHRNARAQTQAVATAADGFLHTLSVEQQQKVMFAFKPLKTAKEATFARAKSSSPGTGGPGGGPGGGPPPEGKPGGPPNGPAPGGAGMGPPGGFVGEQYGMAVWSNYPTSDVPRPGLALGDLSDVQREAAMRLLRVTLSAKGYEKVLETMGSDDALHATGTPFCSGTACYTVGVFGEPSATKPWMLQFGGHHLALNIVIAGEQGVMTPTLTGAQPSVYVTNGKTVRALAEENDTAFALLDSLTAEQRKQAILNYEVRDLVLGPGHGGAVIVPEGVKGSSLNETQRAMLLKVVSAWAGIINDTYAKPRMAEIAAALDETYFAWSGPTTHRPGRNGSAYYRIQGPRVVIEFSPQGVGGDATNHVHTVYRDPTNDYGVRFTGTQ